MGDLHLIGKGRPAEVFAWGDTQVLKLFVAGRDAAAIEAEGRHGIVNDRVRYQKGQPSVTATFEPEGCPAVDASDRRSAAGLRNHVGARSVGHAHQSSSEV